MKCSDKIRDYSGWWYNQEPNFIWRFNLKFRSSKGKAG